MDEEIDDIENNNTQEVVIFPKLKDLIEVKWVYKTKLIVKGDVQRISQGLYIRVTYSYQHVINYNDIFPPLSRLDTMRTTLAIVSQNKWLVYQIAVKSTFLNGSLKE